MKEFFLILFFSKTILLTPDPITLSGTIEIDPEDELTAITSGASIEIDISSSFERSNFLETGIVEARNFLRTKIPEGSVKAILHASDIQLSLEKSSFSLAEGSARLVLSSDNGVPTDVDFDRITIESKVVIRNVQVFWKNFAH